MRVIRDPVFGMVTMIPLFVQHNIKRCNVSGCANKPSTIVIEAVDNDGDRLDFALCEVHYKECESSGKIDYKLDFE